jgi:RNA polymerase sigma-70 factor (ECF subfamily)
MKNAPAAVALRTVRLDAALHRYYARLLKSLARRCGNTADAGDLLHEAVRITIEHLKDGRVRDVERLPGYIFRTALNLLRNHRRVMGNRPQCRAPVESADVVAGPTIADPLHDDSIRREVRVALAALPVERDRAIIRRFYLDEDPKHRICQDLNLSPAHFDRVIFRARQRMKEFLMPQEPTVRTWQIMRQPSMPARPAAVAGESK